MTTCAFGPNNVCPKSVVGATRQQLENVLAKKRASRAPMMGSLYADFVDAEIRLILAELEKRP